MPTQIVLGLVVAVLLTPKMPARALFRVALLPAGGHELGRRLAALPYLFLTDGGLVNWVLHDSSTSSATTSTGSASRWTALAAISILGIWKGVGWSMVIFLAALQGVPRELNEAAAVDGAKAVGAVPRRHAAGDPARRSRS